MLVKCSLTVPTPQVALTLRMKRLRLPELGFPLALAVFNPSSHGWEPVSHLFLLQARQEKYDN